MRRILRSAIRIQLAWSVLEVRNTELQVKKAGMQGVLRLFPPRGLPEQDGLQDPLARARNLFDEAEAYWHSSVELEKAALQGQFSSQPIRNLYHHAIGLYLRAFLSSEGFSLADLEGKFKNDFRRIRKQCEKSGLYFEKPYSETIEYFVRTPLPLRLKYSASGYYAVPTVRALDDLCQMLRLRIADRLSPARSAHEP